MSVTMFRDRVSAAGCLAVAAALALLVVAGCSPAPAPTVAAKPAAAHDHDHGHDHDHDHAAKGQGKGQGKNDDKDDDKDDHGDHDDHDHAHPETLAAALTELESMWGHVHAALKSGERDEADDKVHSVGHLLEDLHGLLAKEKPLAEAEAAGKKAIDEVFACFDTIDTALHGAEEDFKKIDIEEIKPRIEAAIAKLKECVKK
jgi:hypothetical protein